MPKIQKGCRTYPATLHFIFFTILCIMHSLIQDCGFVAEDFTASLRPVCYRHALICHYTALYPGKPSRAFLTPIHPQNHIPNQLLANKIFETHDLNTSMLSKILAMLSRFFTIGSEPFCPMYSTTFSLPKNRKFHPLLTHVSPRNIRKC